MIIFLLATLACFTIPGIFFLSRIDTENDFWENLILGTAVGFAVFTLLSYLLLILNTHFLLIPIIAAADLLYLKQVIIILKKITWPAKNHLIQLLIVFVFGIAGQLAVIAPSGTFQGNNLVFWSAHGHDGSWHISLIEEIKKGYPLQNPVFAGEKLTNYHFFSDIAPADFSKYFRLPPIDLYFRFFPLMFSILLGSLSFLVGKKIGNSFSSGLWAAIFTYFAGSFGYIVTLIQSRGIGGESIFWATQIQSSVGNPPQITVFVILLSFLYLFPKLIQNKSKSLFLICSVLVGLLIVFKVYAGVVSLSCLGLVGLWQLLRERKLKITLLFITSSLLSIILYLPNTSGSASFLIFEPGWFQRTMVVATNRLNWLDLELRRQTYLAEGNIKRVVQIELTAFLIFFFGNLGMRFLGLFYFEKKSWLNTNHYFNLFIFLTALLSLIMPILFLQKGVASNTIQFLQYFLLILGITAGITVAHTLEKIKPVFLKIFLASVVIILALPTQAGLIYEFYSRPPLAKIESEELEALQFLRKSTPSESIILTPPYNKYLDLKVSTPPIWDWFDTAYVAAFSGRRIFLADFEQVDIMGYDLETRQKIQQQIYKEADIETFVESLSENRINYLYFPKSLKPAVDLNQTNLKSVYSNEKAEVWKVN